MKRIIIVDGYNFVFRAYHSMPALSRPSDGMPIGAVYGFTSMMLKLLSDMDPNHIVVVFDSGSKNYRHELYKEYKANRPPVPEDLRPQFPLMREVTKALNVVTLEQIGFEADDVIATIAHKACETKEEVLIVSSDKDLAQLVNPHIKMYDAFHNKEIGEAQVLEKYGVRPDQMLDFLSLVGDASDNIPGVPSIGPKTATELLNKFETLDGIFANLDQITQTKRRTTLQDNRETAMLSRTLVKLTHDVPIPISFDELKRVPIDKEKLITFLTEQGFKSLVARVQGAIAGTHEESEKPIESNPLNVKVVQGPHDVRDLITEAKRAGVVALYFQNSFKERDDIKSFNDIESMSVTTESAHAYYFPSVESGLAPLLPILQDSSILKVFHNYKRFLHVFGPITTSHDDLMMMSYDLGSGRNNTNFEDLMQFYLQEPMITDAKAWQALSPKEKQAYVAKQACLMIQAHEVLSQLLFQYRQLNFYQKIDRPLSKVVYDMEKKGFKVDASILKTFELELDLALSKAEQEVYKCAGIEFNIGSPKQLSDILFTRMNISPPRKSKSGGYSTSASVLEELQEQGHSIADHILEWRRLNKFKTTYTSTLIDQINPETGRVHSTFHLAHTSTGRFSSNEPNLQNIPIKDPLASRIRAAFIAPSGYKILSADYSQIELRLLAAMADVPALSNAFKIGQDIHAMTASEVFGIPADQITPDIRNKAKAINFGIIYGISGHGLARGLGISRFEATEYIKRYLERYSGIAKYMEEQKSIAREYGYVRTIMGRRCYVSDIDSKDFTQRGFAERAAINFPLQGSASDIMRKAMVVLPKALAGLDCKLILQVHDELIFEVKDEDVAESKNIIKRTMESIMDFDIPMVVSINEGDSWSTT